MRTCCPAASWIYAPSPRCALWALAGLGAALAAGCGGAEPFATVPVSGSIKYDDGSLIPAKRIAVVFVPQVEAADAKTHPKQGRAQVNAADGTFAYVTSHRPGDGVTVGRNKVLVMSYDDQNNLTADVPKAYHSVETTPLEVDVGRDTRELPLVVRRN